jgi:RNA polymerase sigma-70 factor (ECF subfamily)
VEAVRLSQAQVLTAPSEFLVEEDTDAIRMVRFKAGDREAFGDLVERHKNAVVNYLTHMTRDRDRAEELAQEAFLRLYLKASQYQERGQLVAYVMRIATNLLRSQERRSLRWRNLKGRVVANEEAPEPSPQSEVLSSEATAQVASALESLPPRFRAPIVLREIEGLSYREIATALRCREGTVKPRINRGREHLRVLLTPYWKGETP